MPVSPGPHADFMCASKKCRQSDGAAPVYDLPTTATRCPVCGSKRLTRLYNAINIARGAQPDHGPPANNSSSMARRLDAIAEPAMLASDAKRARRSAERHASIRAVPVGHLGDALTQLFQGRPMMPVGTAGELAQKATLGGRLQGDAAPALGAIQHQTLRPAVVARDTEFALRRGAGGVEIQKT